MTQIGRNDHKSKWAAPKSAPLMTIAMAGETRWTSPPKKEDLFSDRRCDGNRHEIEDEGERAMMFGEHQGLRLRVRSEDRFDRSLDD